MVDNALITQLLEEAILRFDPVENLPRSPKTGNHIVVHAATYALNMFWFHYEPGYEIACRVLNRICDLQDTRPGRTFGLWAWELEQCLDYDSWFFPDYNCTDFLCKQLTILCKKRGNMLPEDLKQRIFTALRNAAQCTIQRNVGTDYTNIAVMSSLFLVTAGEVLQDDYIFSVGKERLDRLCRFTDACGSYWSYSCNYRSFSCGSCYKGRIFLRSSGRQRLIYYDRKHLGILYMCYGYSCSCSSLFYLR
jgi:hypothetical protein